MTVDDSTVEVTHLAQDAAGNILVNLVSRAAERMTTRIAFAGFPVARAWSETFIGTNDQELAVAENAVTVMVDAGSLTRIRLDLGKP